MHDCVISDMNKSCRNRICEWVMSHTWDMTACIMHEWVISYPYVLYCILYMNKSCRNRVCEWVMSHIWDMTACIMHELVISHSFPLLHNPYERDMTQQSIWINHDLYMRHDCMHHEWMSHISFLYSIASSIWKRHDATEYVNESCHIYASCMTCIMHESHDLWSSDKSFKKTLRLMNNCPQDLHLSFFLSSLNNQHFGLGCGAVWSRNSPRGWTRTAESAVWSRNSPRDYM